ncbi:MAG: hypothetical protein CM15mP74_33590 [Halieaceae bacterium]|nr:MAG: hypothetical protein CM15mP74_33590 [Halieaceae bacterium]
MPSGGASCRQTLKKVIDNLLGDLFLAEFTVFAKPGGPMPLSPLQYGKYGNLGRRGLMEPP